LVLGALVPQNGEIEGCLLIVRVDEKHVGLVARSHDREVRCNRCLARPTLDASRHDDHDKTFLLGQRCFESELVLAQRHGNVTPPGQIRAPPTRCARERHGEPQHSVLLLFNKAIAGNGSTHRGANRVSVGSTSAAGLPKDKKKMQKTAHGLFNGDW
jgi:hypothetical protein